MKAKDPKHIKFAAVGTAAAIVFFAIAIAYTKSILPVAVQVQYQHNSSDQCSVSALSPSASIVTCANGQTFQGFKLIAAGNTYAQVLIYDDCSACMHTQYNSNQYIKVVNVTIGEKFGGACEGFYPSMLVSTSIQTGIAVFYTNTSQKAMICI